MAKGFLEKKEEKKNLYSKWQTQNEPHHTCLSLLPKATPSPGNVNFGTKHLQQCSVCYPKKKIFSHPSLVISLFSNPTLGLQIGRRTTNSKPHGRIIMISQSETGISSHTYLWHCSLTVASANYAKILGQNHFLLSQTGKGLTFLHPILICKVRYYLSTIGVAL